MSEITIVLDRGMITKKNLQYIEAMGYKYIIALRKTDGADIVNSPLNEAEMQPLKEGQYVRLFETLTDRYAVVLNVQKREDDYEYREGKIGGAIKELDKLNETIQKGHLVERDKIIGRVTLILNKYKVRRYIRWRVPEGNGKLVDYTRNEKEITRDAIYDGVYVLRTNKEGLSSEEIVNAYKQLMRVEMAFRCLKDVLEIRPVYHWREDRVKAHVYICVISYLIHTVIEYLLKRNGIQISADTFLERINRVKLITLTDKAHKVIVHKVTKSIDEEVKQSLSAIGIKTIKAERMYWRK